MHGLRPIFDLVQDLLVNMRSANGYAVLSSLLALVFTWSGATKVIRPAEAAIAIREFGVVRHPRAWQAVALGVLEMSLAVALVVTPGRAVAACAGLLLAAFTFVIGRALLRGERFACRCFGGDDESISAATLARTSALLTAALLLCFPVPDVNAQVVRGTHGVICAGLAVAILLTILLLGRVPRLTRWNREVVRHYRTQAEQCRP